MFDLMYICFHLIFIVQQNLWNVGINDTVLQIVAIISSITLLNEPESMTVTFHKFYAMIIDYSYDDIDPDSSQQLFEIS